MVRQVTGWTGISSFSGVSATMSTGHGTDSSPQAELSGEKSESPSVLARLGLFKQCPNLRRVVWPSSVPYMENYMFLGCENLLEIKLPDGMKMIGHRSFLSCKNLAKVYLPDSVEWLGFGAFCGCELLEFVYLSKEIRGFYSDTFARCKKLSFLQYGRNNCSIRIKTVEKKFVFLEPPVLQTGDFLGYDMQGYYFLQYQDIISCGKNIDFAGRQLDRLHRMKERD